MAVKKPDETAAVVQESAEDPGQTVQEVEVGEGAGPSQTGESSDGQEAICTLNWLERLYSRLPAAR